MSSLLMVFAAWALIGVPCGLLVALCHRKPGQDNAEVGMHFTGGLMYAPFVLVGALLYSMAWCSGWLIKRIGKDEAGPRE